MVRVARANSICIHEASHAIVAMHFGVRPALVWANEFDGKCFTGGPKDATPFNRLTILAAGYGSNTVIPEFSFQTVEPEREPMTASETSLREDDISSRAMATAYDGMVSDGSVDEAQHDHKQIEDIVCKLLAEGQIMPRQYVVNRWHSRAEERARTILRRNKKAVMTLAKALAIKGALNWQEISGLLGAARLGDASTPSLRALEGVA